MNELVINKKTDLLKVINRDKYTKLVLNCDVSPNYLIGLKNIKELIINGNINETNNKNEINLSKFPFANSLEILKINNVKNLGKRTYKKNYYGVDFSNDNIYSHALSNLKIIELPNCIEDIDLNYFNEMNSLEEIIINANNETKLYQTINMPNNLKHFIIKYNNKEFKIVPDYKIKSIQGIDFIKLFNSVFLYYYNDTIRTDVKINNIPKINNRLVTLTNNLIDENNILYIPDYITSINREQNKITYKIKGISLNSDLLKTNIHITKDHSQEFILTPYDCKYLEKIIIRRNNEMSLFQNKEYDIKEYGEIEKIYINNNKLVLEYEDLILEIDESGLNKSYKIKEIKTNNKQKLSKEKELELDKYTTEELIDYLCYKRFLEFVKTKINDKEINEHLNIIKEKVIKKLIK